MKESFLEKKVSPKNKQTFEDAMQKLEKIAKQLESGDLDLDDALKEFEQGMSLAKYCHDKLEEAERKIEILQKGNNESVKIKNVKIKDTTGELDEDEDLQGSLL